MRLRFELPASTRPALRGDSDGSLVVGVGLVELVTSLAEQIRTHGRMSEGSGNTGGAAPDQTPARSGVPFAVRGAGAVRFSFPSLVRGIACVR
jgi:hypothetical protein